MSPVMDTLSNDGSSVSVADSGFDESSVDSAVLTSDIVQEEQKLQLENEKKVEKLRREYEKQQHDEEMKKLRYKRLMHLLEKSQFYASFMQDKVHKLLGDNKKAPNNKGKNKRKRDELEDYSEEIEMACKKNKLEADEAEDAQSKIPSEETKPNENLTFNGNSTEKLGKSVFSKVETRVTSLGIEVPIIQPKLLEGAALRDYQLDGLNWLKILFETGMNGILADEMGLGKTVQIIALICHLYEHDIHGPFLIIGPLSTLPNWLIEFSRFAPQLPVILYHGPEKDRSALRKRFRNRVKLNGEKVLPVILTSYEIPIRDEHFLQQFHWKYIIVDEGHRVKNYKSQLSRVLSSFRTVNRLLLTGTPLQNNLTELWSLLNFLLPEIFDSLDAFHSWFQVEDMERGDVAEAFLQQERKDKILTTLHQILTPFLLRRVKSEVNLFLPPKKEVIVYCPLTSIQKKLYEAVLDRSIVKMLKEASLETNLIIEDNPDGTKVKRRSALRKNNSFYDNEELEEKNDDLVISDGMDQYKLDVKMQNTSMILRKIVNHPYLVQMPVLPGSSIIRVDEGIVTSSGKVVMLDGLLKRLKERNHKVLIFSTFTSLLNLLEDLMVMREYSYERLDGQCNLESRKNSIYRFNTDESVFTFLISTRAGGLGINLTAADTVIIYDSDWNPQADLQAQDRCHRIGQTKPVIVYRFVTEGSVDEKIVTRAAAKRKLEKMIIHGGKFNHSMKVAEKRDVFNYEDLKELLNKKQHNKEIRADGSLLTEEEWEALLDRTALDKEDNEGSD